MIFTDQAKKAAHRAAHHLAMFLLFCWFVLKLLAAEGCLIHQTALGNGENRHTAAAVVAFFGHGVQTRICARRSRTRPSGRGLRLGARSQRHRAGLRAKLKIAR